MIFDLMVLKDRGVMRRFSVVDARRTNRVGSANPSARPGCRCPGPTGSTPELLSIDGNDT